jgi:hypothetical protein
MQKEIRFTGRDRGWDTMGTKSWNRKEAGQVNASLNILSDALQAYGRAGGVVPEASGLEPWGVVTSSNMA